MKETRPQDIFSVRKASVYSLEDDAYLLDMYSPIITLKNASIYLALRNEIGNETNNFSSFYEKYQVSEGEVYNALEALEAIGLIKTYFLEKSQDNSYVFFLYCPRSPSEFFSNELLVGTLTRYTSEEYVNKIIKKYSLNDNQDGYKNISTSFMNYFQLDAEKGIYKSLNSSLLGRKCSTISLSFNKKDFIAKLNETSNVAIKETTFSKEEYVKLARIATLFAFDEEMMASLLSSSSSVFNISKEYGNRINFYNLEKLCKDNETLTYTHRRIGKDSEVSGNGGLAYVIREMDRLTSKEFLKKLQNGGEPARSDEKLIEKIVVDMGLPQNVTNALLFYVLKIRGQSVINASYIEKLAASLVREGTETALDALNFLGNTSKEMQNKSKKTYSKANKDFKKKEEVKEVKEEKPVETKEETIDDDEYEDFLNSL